jgi:hypothetical protein
MDDYADQRMSEMFDEKGASGSDYVNEYNEVICQINSLCNAISHNHKPSNRTN